LAGGMLEMLILREENMEAGMAFNI